MMVKGKRLKRALIEEAVLGLNILFNYAFAYMANPAWVRSDGCVHPRKLMQTGG